MMRICSIVNQVSHPSYNKLGIIHQISGSSYNFFDRFKTRSKYIYLTSWKNKRFEALHFHSGAFFSQRDFSVCKYDIRHHNNRNDFIYSKGMLNKRATNLVYYPNNIFSNYYNQQNRPFSSSYHKSFDNAKIILTKLKKNSKIDKNVNTPNEINVLTVQNINNCLIKLSKSPQYINIKTASLAQNILKQMEFHSSTSFYLQPDTYTYNAVLNILAKCNGGLIAAQDAEEILESMINRFQINEQNRNKKRKCPHPTTITFHCVMDAYAKCQSKDSGIQAQRILERMITFRNEKKIKKDLKPSVRTYSILVNAWANSNSDNAAEQANMILDELILKIRQQKYRIKQNQENDPIVDQTKLEYDNDVLWPNSILLNTVIKAWTRSKKGIHSINKAQDILNKMEQSMIMYSSKKSDSSYSTDTLPDFYGYDIPNVRSYSLVLDAWAKSKHKQSSSKVEAIFNRMHEFYDKGYNVKPNRFTYTIVINALAKSKEKGSAERAEKILNRMIQLYNKAENNDDDDDDDLKPTIATFNTVIDAWSRSKEINCGQRAQNIFNQLQSLNKTIPSLKPDITTYNSLITAWARCSKIDKNAISFAEQLIHQMEHSRINIISPNTITYNALLDAYSHCKQNDHIEKALSIIHKMEKQFENGNENVKPDLITYTSMINVYARSNTSGLAENANKIFQRLIGEDYDKMKLKPDLMTYSCLLQACANTRGNSNDKQIAFDIAYTAYNHLIEESKKDKKMQPNKVIYRILIEVFGFMSNEKTNDRLLEKVFVQCCQDGHLDPNVLRTFRRAASSLLFDTLVLKYAKNNIKNGKVCRINDLPSEWSANIYK